MRIALTSNFSPWSPYSGGGQRSTHQLGCALVALGHDVTVVYTRAPGEPVEPDAPVPYRIVWATFVGRRSRRNAPLRPFNGLSVARAVAHLQREAPLDAVHSQGEEGCLVPRLAARAGFRFVLTPRFPWYPAGLERRPASPRRAWLWLAQTKYPLIGIAARGAHAVCPTSHSSAEAVVRALQVPRDRIEVVPNGVNPAFFQRRWAGARDDTAPIVFFGRLDRDKGADTLLEAWAQIDGGHRLVLVGRGDQRPALARLAHQLGVADRVDWRDWCPPGELADLLASAAAVALPSRHESFGNSMAEALAVGAPLVTCRAGSIPEVTGDAAVLVPPGDPRALATALDHLLRGDTVSAVELSAAGRARMEARFRWEAVARRYARLYAGGLPHGLGASASEADHEARNEPLGAGA